MKITLKLLICSRASTLWLTLAQLQNMGLFGNGTYPKIVLSQANWDKPEDLGIPAFLFANVTAKQLFLSTFW